MPEANKKAVRTAMQRLMRGDGVSHYKGATYEKRKSYARLVNAWNAWGANIDKTNRRRNGPDIHRF